MLAAQTPTSGRHRPASRSLRGDGLACAGFTMIELVTIMIIVGILAVFAMPRVSQLGSFDARGFRDQTASLLRYAQKQALAQRRAVCVEVTATAVNLTIDTNTPPDNTCDGSLKLPFQPRAGSGLSGADFQFRTRGETDQSLDINLSIVDADPIVVDAITGYVR